MKCPHCFYQHGWDGETCEYIQGVCGKFYKISNDLDMVRHTNAKPDGEHRSLIGCPDCNKIFME